MKRAAAVATVAVVTAGLLGSGATSASGQGAVTRTHRAVVRPVDASGHARPGWTVHRARGLTVQCDGSASAAVDDGIYACFPTAAYLPACWPSGHHTVLCLRDARSRKLVRVQYSGSLGRATASDRPSPQDLDLAHGEGCSLRVGGAWDTLPTHPNWLGFYSCAHGSVYGPQRGDGVDRSTQPWTVRIWKSGTKHRVLHRSVAAAYFVGTHA
jgi:hypothetical protein